MAPKTTSSLHSPTDSQSKDIMSIKILNNTVEAIRTRRRQTKRSVGSTRILGILAIDLDIVADEERFLRRYTKSTGENNGRVFVCASYICFTTSGRSSVALSPWAQYHWRVVRLDFLVICHIPTGRETT
jgi:hypothetical protein